MDARHTKHDSHPRLDKCDLLTPRPPPTNPQPTCGNDPKNGRLIPHLQGQIFLAPGNYVKLGSLSVSTESVRQPEILPKCLCAGKILWHK